MNGLRPADIFSIFKRRYWMIIVCVTLLAPIGVVVAFSLPSKYRATANVRVEGPQIAPVLADTTVSTVALERLNAIRQRLLARDELIKIVENLELFDDRPNASPAEKISYMRQNIQISEVFGGTARAPKLVGIKVSFIDEGPGRAARIANELVDLILAWNIEDRTETAQQTRAFFQTQVDELSVDISLTEKEIADYQRANACCLPSTLLQRQTQLAALQGQSVQREQNLFTLEEQRRTIQNQIDSGVFRTTAQKSPAEQQLDALNLQLTQLLGTLSENNPRIRALRAQIGQLEQAVGTTSINGVKVSPAELQARQQIEGIGRQIDLIKSQEQASLDKQAEIEQSIDKTSQVDLELKRLNRVLTNLQAQLGEATRDLNVALQGEEIEQQRQGERFELVEPAQVPSYAESPNKRIIAAGGVFAGVFLGAGLMVLFELLDRSIRTSYAMEHRVGLRPVVSIPYVRTTRERVVGRLRWALFFLTLLIVIPALLYAVDSYLIPLEQLIEKVAEKAGLTGVIDFIEAKLGL